MAGDTAISILQRLIDLQGDDLSPAVAKAVLRIRFNDQDQERLAELAFKSTTGQLQPQELEEYDSYIAAADLLSLWKSKARLSLKHQTTAA
jgi:hypothetical protein